MSMRNRAGWMVVMLVLLAGLLAGMAQAQTITKANITTALNAGGSWVGGVVPGSGDTALWDSTVSGANSSTLGGSMTWGQIQITNPGGAITIANTAAAALTLNGVGGSGIDMSAATQNLTINNPVNLASTQAWTIGSGRNLTINNYVVSGAGGLTKDGSGTLSLLYGSGNNPTYSGPTTVNGGILRLGGGGSGNNLSGLPSGNITLNGGVFDVYWGNAFTRNLGSGTNQIQITGGDSGFSQLASTQTLTIKFGNNNTPIVWGSSYFSPSVLVLNSVNGFGTVDFQNYVDIDGVNRSVQVNAGTGKMSGILSNSSGTAAGITKTGAGELQLTQANTFDGQLTVEDGTLSVASINNANANGPLGNSALAVILGTSGTTGTLKYTGGTTSSTKPFTMATGGTGAFDVSTAATILTLSSQIDGDGALSKVGSGTLTLTGTNTYAGTTTVSAGMLSIGAANNLGIGGKLVINGGGLSITGTTLNSLSGLGRTVEFSYGAGLRLDIADAGNMFTVDQSLPSGGLLLSGAGTAVFQGSVSNLVLNTPTGVTATYGGAIANGASGMTVTKIGAGTQVLQGANTYTGATYLNEGTLILSGNGSILNSAVHLQGGGLTLLNTAAETGSGRVADATGISANDGTITYSNTSGANVYAETIGTVALSGGQLNIVEAVNQASTGSQTLTLAGLTRSGTAAVTFSAATTGPDATKNRIMVSGASATPAGQIIGAWATTGTAANNQNDYAVYDASGYIVARNTAGSDETTWTTAANAYSTSAGGTVTLTGSRAITALRNTGATTVLTLASGANLETYGVLNGAATLLFIAPGTGGVLTTPTGGGSLYLTTHGINTDTSGAHNGITVTAPINNNGSDAVTLVKSGVGVLQLNATSSYSGGTVLNSGTLWAQTDASLGDVNGDITFNGSATLLLAPNNGTGGYSFSLPSTRSIIVNNGAMATIAGGRANAAITINGDISGSGGMTVGRVALLSAGGIGTPYTFSLLGNNTFTGAFNVGNGLETAGAGGTAYGVTINSLTDSTSPITLNFGQNGALFSLGSGASSSLSVPNRPVDLRNSNMTIRNQNATYTMTLGPVSTSTAGAKELKLGDGGAGATIAGAITDGAGSIAVTKSGSGTWTLSGDNTYSGTTTVSGGTLALRGDYSLPHTGTLNRTGGSIDIEGRAQVAVLQAAGVSFPPGIYGSTSSGAQYSGAQLTTVNATTVDNFFTGTAVLFVGTPYPPSGTVLILR